MEFKIDYKEEKNPDGKLIYVSLIPPRTTRIIFTNKYKILEYHKDLNIVFKEYYFTLETFYYRIKQLELQIAKNCQFGNTTAKLFMDMEEMRFNVFIKKESAKYVCEVASYLGAFNTQMCHLCFRISKSNYLEAETIYHILCDLHNRFYSVLENSYDLHLNKTLKLF